jgi:hypothetical protein
MWLRSTSMFYKLPDIVKRIAAFEKTSDEEGP